VLKRGLLHAAQGEQQLDALLVVTPDGKLLWPWRGAHCSLPTKLRHRSAVSPRFRLYKVGTNMPVL